MSKPCISSPEELPDDWGKDEMSQALKKAMELPAHWSMRVPVEPGWYWWRKRNNLYKTKIVWSVFIIKVFRRNGILKHSGDDVRIMGGEWSSSTIAEPEEAS